MEKNKTDREKLKALREQRADMVGRAKDLIKKNTRLIKKIKEQIKDQALAIPQIAQAIQEPSATVLVYVSGLKKFGLAVEKEKDGDYFKYQLSSTDTL